jgi:putative Mn2+ efflux pump MntP
MMGMELLMILGLAIGLAMDAFAVSIAAGTNSLVIGKRATFRISFHFGLFQGLMPILGWLAGTRIAPLIQSFDHWVALLLLSFIGGKMILSGSKDDSDSDPTNPSKGWNLVMLSIATSIDALAVGLSLGMLNVRIWFPSLVIGIVTGLLSLVGVLFGNRLGMQFGRRIEIVGGMILIFIGLRILYSHLFTLSG